MRTILLSVLAYLAISTGQQTQPQPSFTIAVKVDLVVLNASVRHQDGSVATGLRSRDFRIDEDGVPQEIRVFQHEDAPAVVGLVIDHSGSMRRKLAEVIAAARTFVQQSRKDDELFVINFNERSVLVMPGPVLFTNRVDELSYAIALMPPSGETALYDATAHAFDRLKTARLDKKALILISDGGDNASVRSKSEVLRTAAQSTALVYAIGIFDGTDPDRNPGVLRELARSTGGEAFFPRTLNDIGPVCERIASDIRNQYTLGYVSSNVSGKGYRKIRVSAADGQSRLVVRARAGYRIGE